MRKEAKELVRELRALGLDVETSRRGGHVLVRRDGGFLCSFSATPSCGHAMKNARADLRRLGVPV